MASANSLEMKPIEPTTSAPMPAMAPKPTALTKMMAMTTS